MTLERLPTTFQVHEEHAEHVHSETAMVPYLLEEWEVGALVKNVQNRRKQLWDANEHMHSILREQDR